MARQAIHGVSALYRFHLLWGCIILVKLQGSLTNQSFSEGGDRAGFPAGGVYAAMYLASRNGEVIGMCFPPRCSLGRASSNVYYLRIQICLPGSSATPGGLAAEEMTELVRHVDI